MGLHDDAGLARDDNALGGPDAISENTGPYCPVSDVAAVHAIATGIAGSVLPTVLIADRLAYENGSWELAECIDLAKTMAWTVSSQGPQALRAALDPDTAASSVVFFVDGRQICTVAAAPFECAWDAGAAILRVSSMSMLGYALPNKRGSTVKKNRRGSN